MNRKLPRLILILLIVTLCVALFACSPAGEENPPIDNNLGGDTNSGENPPISQGTINKGQIFSEIRDGLVTAGEIVNERKTGYRYVDSEYVFIANSVNVGIEYQANYSLERAQDSEIMVRIFDYNKEANTSFIYFVNNTLYVQMGEEYMKMENFGGTSTFQLFYETITSLDMEHTLFSVNFADNIEAMSGSAETQKISKIILSDNEFNVSVKDINLDPVKTKVNEFIQDNIASLGTRFDALTNKLLGFELSDLGRVQVGRFNAEMLAVLEKQVNGEQNVTDFHINFAGNQANNIDTYYFDVNYSTKYERGEIRLTQFDNPNSNNYVSKSASSIHYVGSVYIPSTDQSFDAEIKGNFSASDNSINELFVDIVNRTANQGQSFSKNERVFGLSYKDGVVYLDAKGAFEKYIGDFMEYESLGLPRVKFDGLNMAEELQALLEKAISLVDVDFGFGGIFGSVGSSEESSSIKDNPTTALLMEKVRSEDGVFYITIDSEVISEIIGESEASLIATIANSLGIEEGLIRDIIGLGYFDDIALEIAWDTETDNIILTAKLGEQDLLVLTLQNMPVGPDGLDVAFPDREETGYFDTFGDFQNPEIINVHIEGTVRTQGKAENDVSKLMGLFIGDITGTNTPYKLKVSDEISLNMNLWQKGNEFYVDAKVKLNDEPFVDICSNVENPDELLINNYVLGVKYIMPREEILYLLGELTENKTVWEFESIVNAIEVFVQDSRITRGEHLDADKDGLCDKCSGVLPLRDFLRVIVSPTYDASGATVRDPLKDVFGAEDFIAELGISFSFSAPSGLANPDEYVTPIISLIEEERWTSIYEAKWVETASVSFGTKAIEFALDFEGESAIITPGVYEYYPKARLFGQYATYRMFITDTVNGTKKIKELNDRVNSVYLMEIDPSFNNPIPTKVNVVYEDGTVGEIAYEFVDFPYTNDNVINLMGGRKKETHRIVIGKGSIAEKEFEIDVIVKGRNFVVGSNDYYNNIPIVARVTIDPYQYSIEKRDAIANGESYYAFKYRADDDASGLASNVLALGFYDYAGSSKINYEYLTDFDWGFDEDLISYTGGEFTKVQKFNDTLQMAIVIKVEAKIVNYIQINSENPGYYTIDSLVTDTYTIPTATTYRRITDGEGNVSYEPINEVRIYFSKGRYRIIGVQPEGYEITDENCDGYYPQSLDWSHKVADNVTIDRSVHPLAGGTTKYTECVFGDDVVGMQAVTLEVACPTRVIGTRASTVVAITSIGYLEDGSINPGATITSAIKLSLASFDKDSSVENDYFDFDPYTKGNASLPDVVYVNVTYQGRVQTLGYPVQEWIIENNILESPAKIKNAFAEETFMRVRCVIGDGELTQTLEMAIQNHAVRYQEVNFMDENGKEIATTVKRFNAEGTEIAPGVIDQEEVSRGYYVEGLNPYELAVLPSFINLVFPLESGVADQTFPATKWYLKDEMGDPVLDGEGNVLDAIDYVVNPLGGIVTIYVDLVSGDLTQTVALNLVYRSDMSINANRIYGLASIDEFELVESETIHYMRIDTYDEVSQKLYDDLTIDGGIKRVDVSFADGGRTYGNVIDIEWNNLDEFLSVLKSPFGSSTYYNMGKYQNDIIFLEGTIRKGTVQERTIRMGFMVVPRVLGDINFGNFDKGLTVKDDSNVSAVEFSSSIERVKGETQEVDGVTVPVLGANGYQVISVSGYNTVNMTFNKYFALTNADGLCSPSAYIDYVFKNVSLSFSDTVRVNDLDYVLPENFDDLIYGNVTSTGDANVTLTSTYVKFTVLIEKLSKGSCVQPFTVTLVFIKDRTVIGEDEAYNEAVEIFEEDGTLKYNDNVGYVLPSEFVVNYVRSGEVKYNDLEWRVDETVSSLVNNSTMASGSVVNSIKSDYFNFTSTRIIKLYTILPNGQKYRRHISFYSKNVNFTKYHTEIDSSIENGKRYQIKDGTLYVDNVYDYLPLDNLMDRISATIVPDQTSSFISSYDIKFTLENGWIPSADFADANGEIDVQKLSEAVTSAGLNPTLLATGTIRGYNEERQEIRLFIAVRQLSAGQISHKDYSISGNNMVFDQYLNDGDGVFVLPKDIKVTFGDVAYQFANSDAVKYEIRYKHDITVFAEINAITYNSKGHTLSAEYGYGANDEIYLRVTLPDGNKNLRLIVTFPCRTLKEVSYYSKTDAGKNMLLSGVYYIDPYDRETFSIPTSAEFKYYQYYNSESDNAVASGYVTQDVKWTLGDDEDAGKFTLDGNGNYVYVGGEYAGASYLFYSKLKGFDATDKDQYFILQVFVLNREVTTPVQYPSVYNVVNPFTILVEDLPSTLDASDFYDLSSVKLSNGEEEDLRATLEGKGTVSYYKYTSGESVYRAEFVSAIKPVIPNVLWKKGRNINAENLVNDDLIATGGYTIAVYGAIGMGAGEDRTYGQFIDMSLSAKAWVFNQVEGLDKNVIELNDFTLVSIESEFVVSFIVTDDFGTPETVYVTFYPEYYVDSVDKERTVMVWNKNNWADSAELGSITFVNRFKSAIGNQITTNAVYKFDAQQVGIDELDFGFGSGYAYTGEVELVIDPLNPVIPTTALARGRLNLDAGTLIYLGEVNVEWENTDSSDPESIYYIDMDGGTKTVYCNVTSMDDNSTAFKFAVRATYLNRTPTKISTAETGYTNVAKDGAYYPLLRTVLNSEQKLVKNYTFVVDPTPTDNRLFNVDGATNVLYPLQTGGYARSNYRLPSTVVLNFANDYNAGGIESEGISKLGAEITLIDVEWVISRDISLVGTAVSGSKITAKIARFRVQYVADGQIHTSNLYNFIGSDALGDFLTLQLTTTNRQVSYTYVLKNGEQAVLSEVPQGSTTDYQQARDEFYIDPYNIAFPAEVYVIFDGSTIPYHATDIEWTYDESHLAKHGVITGQVEDKYMQIMASMSVYGTTLQVQFPIKARNIPVSKDLGNGQTTMDPMSGGTLYVLAGIPAEEQLPTKLYYRFDYEDGTSEIASVPLSFPPNSISIIQTDVPGRVYSHVEAKLGLVDDDNVYFTIKVIDPKLYVLRSTVQNSAIGSVAESIGYVNGGFVYDYIAIGVNAAGAYVPGPETSVLPDKIIVSDDGEFMDIVNVTYDVENMIATIECRYTFLSFSDSPRLSGDKDATGENGDKMFLSFSVPIKTYAYNWIEEETALFEKTVYYFPLGTVVTASDMPTTVSGITPIWELDGINNNRAGEYVATCHYKNAYGKIITGEVIVVIERRAITADDFTWVTVDGINFRDRIYDGNTLNVKDYIQCGEFLRDDGTYSSINFTVQYSIDGRVNWQTEQPVQVKENASAPDYFVRIIVTDEDDYNYTGSVAYRMIINKCVINAEDIFFYGETDALGNPIPIEETDYTYIDATTGGQATIKMKQISLEYTGGERKPYVGGIPRGAVTNSIYAVYDANRSQQAYNDNVKPVDVGTYIMSVEFAARENPEYDRNYTIADADFIILIHVTKKQVNYSIKPEYDYTGEYFDVTVNGLPEVLGDIQVTYTYKNASTGQTLSQGSKIKDAGEYDVTVRISGGRNYPDANLEGGAVYTALYEQRVTVRKRQVVLNVGTITGEYLEELAPLNSAITIKSALNDKEDGLVGRYDKANNPFANLEVVWVGGTLTYKHMVGSYKLSVVNAEAMLAKDFHTNYEFVAINDGSYEIVAEKANTRVIANRAELEEALAQLNDRDTAIWYFMPGSYGSIIIDKDASVSIIGSYDLTSEEEVIAVKFDQIVINKGAVLLDIVAFNDKANDSVVKLGKMASSLTVSRSTFTRASSGMLTNSVAIGSESGYSNTVYVSDTYFSGYSTAIYLLGGSLELRASHLYENMNGVYLQRGSVILDTNIFDANRGYAVNIAYAGATTSIFDNVFTNNDVAIKTVVELRKDIRVQNTFRQNTVTFDGWTE